MISLSVPFLFQFLKGLRLFPLLTDSDNEASLLSSLISNNESVVSFPLHLIILYASIGTLSYTRVGVLGTGVSLVSRSCSESLVYVIHLICCILRMLTYPCVPTVNAWNEFFYCPTGKSGMTPILWNPPFIESSFNAYITLSLSLVISCLRRGCSQERDSCWYSTGVYLPHVPPYYMTSYYSGMVTFLYWSPICNSW